MRARARDRKARGSGPFTIAASVGAGTLRRVVPTRALILGGVDDEEHPPICPACGVTMVPAALSARERRGEVWICVECEEHDDPDVV